ncbi:MAG: single-stranded DNA-binding protein [Patescibacteria group bacterium]
MNLNKVFILGRLTADPQLRTTPSGQSVASFGVATNRVWTDKSGAKQQGVEYHNIVAWGRQAEIINQFLSKGGLVFIEGRLQTRTWQDQQGQSRKTTEIICEKMQLGPRQGDGNKSSPRQNSGTDEPTKEELPEIDIGEGEIKAEDLPF